jgi:hypothetical protein
MRIRWFCTYELQTRIKVADNPQTKPFLATALSSISPVKERSPADAMASTGNLNLATHSHDFRQ